MHSPDQKLNPDDPGDDTQLRFRYQHAYGVILLVAAVCGRLPYVALWCEHHDDYLAERSDGMFDSFQLKTRKPELGHWECTSDALISSVRRFVSLDETFPRRIGAFCFVSNAAHFKTKKAKDFKKSPVLLKQAVMAVTSITDLSEPFAGVLKKMAINLDLDEKKVFAVWKRLELVRGPSLDDFDAVVAHEHLGAVPACMSLSPPHLNGLRDELIFIVFRASSLSIVDGAKHWIGATSPDALQPRLHAKRISLDEVKRALLDSRKVPFRFAPAPDGVQLGAAADSMDVMEKKLIKGGLAGYTETFRRRALSAERHLLELRYQQPKEIEVIMDQLDGVVRDEAADAKLEASQEGPVYGEKMLCILSNRLRTRAKERPETIYNQEYECLMGLAGLLTSECKIWWSKPFDVKHPL